MLDEAAASVDQFVVGIWEAALSVSGFDDDGFLYGYPKSAMWAVAWLIQEGAGLVEILLCI